MYAPPQPVTFSKRLCGVRTGVNDNTPVKTERRRIPEAPSA